MNPGYLTILMVMAILILISCGWRNILFKDIPWPILFGMIIGWLGCSFFTFSMNWHDKTVEINAAFLFLGGCGLFILFRYGNMTMRIHMLTAAILLCLFNDLLRGIVRLQAWEMDILMAAAAVVLQRKLPRQLLSLLLGLLLSHSLTAIIYSHEYPLVIASHSVQDTWWLMLFTVCIFSGLSDWAGSVWLRQFSLRKRGAR